MPLDAENGKEKHRVMPRFKGVFALRTDAYNEVYGPAERAAIPELIDVIVLPPSVPPPCSFPNVMLMPPDIWFLWLSALPSKAGHGCRFAMF
jgi:hypothetical protein